MMSLDDRLRDVMVLANIAQCKQDLLPALDLTATTLRELTCDLRAWQQIESHMHQLFDALPISQAKPSKKRPRSAKPRTSTRRKA